MRLAFHGMCLLNKSSYHLWLNVMQCRLKQVPWQPVVAALDCHSDDGGYRDGGESPEYTGVHRIKIINSVLSLTLMTVLDKSLLSCSLQDSAQASNIKLIVQAAESQHLLNLQLCQISHVKVRLCRNAFS